MPPMLVTFVQGREEPDGSGSSDVILDLDTDEYEVTVCAGDGTIQITISSMTTSYESPGEMLGMSINGEEKSTAFIAIFGEWLNNNVMDDGDKRYYEISPSVHSTFEEVQDKYNELKAQYLAKEVSE